MRRIGPSLLGIITLLMAAPAVAQQPSATLDRYAASETPEDDFHLSRASDFGHLRFGAQIHLDYALNPLVFEGMLGDASTENFPIVEHQLVGTVGLSFGLFDRVVIFAGLPVTLLMDGADSATVSAFGLSSADDAGLGDMTVGGRVRIVGEDDDFGALALQVSASLPTASYDDQSYRGEDHVTFLPELIGELRPGLGSRIVLNVGARLREEDPVGMTNLEFRHALTFGLGFAIPLWTDEDPRTHLDLHAQIYGSTAFAYAFEREHTPLEATAGLKFFHASGFIGGLAAGPGITRGFGSPDLRVIGTVAWAMPEDIEQTVGDEDGDGLLDNEDQCPSEPEDQDDFEDTDGCPDVDNDQDGILDTADSCPNEPETVNEVEDADGCPDDVGDSDGDGILDTVDECPTEPEDRDEFEDDNGCPDPDNDGDGVLDEADECPMVPGAVENRGCPDADRDGDTVVDREDNCPDEPGTVENHGCQEVQQVVITEGRLEILDRVYFRTNRAVIQTRSHALLMNVARVLNNHPEIARIRVEGHTDARGRRQNNLRLSQRRAEAVVTFLVSRGEVDEGRLEAQGFGPDRPVVEDASTAEQHAQNRRVEFNIPEEAGIQQQDSAAGSDTIDR